MWDALNTFIKGFFAFLMVAVLAAAFCGGALISVAFGGCVGFLLYCIVVGVIALLFKK